MALIGLIVNRAIGTVVCQRYTAGREITQDNFRTVLLRDFRVGGV